jgi:acyl carrier protein
MELNNFLDKFKEQYADYDEIVLTADADFRQIDSYDSLTGMAILVMIKDLFDVDLTDDEYKSLHSIHEVYDYIQNRIK